MNTPLSSSSYDHARPALGRKPRDAAALSLLMPGLGHVYCGQLRKGLALMVAATGLVLVFLPPIALDVRFKAEALACGAILSLALCAYAIVDAARTAKRASPDFVPQVFNHWTIYAALFLLGGCTGPLASALFVRDKFLQPFKIPTLSMAPALMAGDRVLAVKDRYRHRDPTRGELVVFANPKSRGQMYVKRVVALAGDTVEVRQGKLHLNGQPLPLAAMTAEEFTETNGVASYRILIRAGGQAPENFGPVVVAPDHVFVLGDNRNYSKDSRELGAVAIGSLEGRMAFIYWPAQSWGRFGEIW